MKSERNSQSLLEIVKEHAASEKLSLPIFPGVLGELQSLISDENAPIDKIAVLIGKDQALASQMLKLANSAFFSGLTRVRNVRDAILRLGLNQVFNCLVSSSQSNYYKSSHATVDRYLQILWRHALATAMGSKWLLQKTGYRDLADEGFLAGLLHDIGKLLLLRVIETVSAEREDMNLSEVFILEILDSMHVEQGYNLMKEWSIPSVYCDVTKDHHTDEFDSSDALLMAVRTVNQVCRKAGISTNPERQIVPASLPEAHALAAKEIVLAELEVIIEDAMLLEFGA
jgi:HD-like signal output (HDOD) protein